MLEIYHIVIAVLIGFILDMIIGDPQYAFHPIRFVGKLIEITEAAMRKAFPNDKNSLIMAGGATVVIVCVATYLVTAWLVMICYSINFFVGLAVEGIMCYFIISAKALKTESMKVYHPLKNGDLEDARKAVSMIVGRDTKSLSDIGIAKAAIETVAENTADGVIGPLLFMVLGGPIWGFTYKAINTMDSMLGYKNEKYLNFGRIAAQLDDIVNYIPARLSAYFMIISSFLIGLNGKNAIKIYKRDKFNHASPNSAHTEAVCAGALEISLAGDAYYFGVLHKKQTIGDDIRPVEYEDIKKINKLMYATAFLSLIVFLSIKAVYIYLFLS